MTSMRQIQVTQYNAIVGKYIDRYNLPDDSRLEDIIKYERKSLKPLNQEIYGKLNFIDFVFEKDYCESFDYINKQLDYLYSHVSAIPEDGSAKKAAYLLRNECHNLYQNLAEIFPTQLNDIKEIVSSLYIQGGMYFVMQNLLNQRDYALSFEGVLTELND